MEEGEGYVALEGPRSYHLLTGELYVKTAQDPQDQKVLKVPWPAGSRIPTTGQLWKGPDGCLWAELQQGGLEDWVWTLVQGPGYGLRGRLLESGGDTSVIQIFGSGNLDNLHEVLVPRKSAKVKELIDELAAQLRLDRQKVRLQKGAFDVQQRRTFGMPLDRTLKEELTIEESKLSGALTLTYTGPAGATAARPRDLQQQGVASGAPTGGAVHFEVVITTVAVRREPSTASQSLGGLSRGKIVYGTPFSIEGNPWIRLDAEECRKIFARAREAWVLIHGACVGKGQLLRKLAPEEEAAQIKLRRYTEEAAKKSSLLEAKLTSMRLQDAKADIAAEGLFPGGKFEGKDPDELSGTYLVVGPSVTIHSFPAAASEPLGTLDQGAVIPGKGHVLEGVPWLHLGRETCLKVSIDKGDAWVLIHGGTVGLGLQLRRLSAEEVLRDEKDALERARREADEQRKALEAERAEFEARKQAAAELPAIPEGPATSWDVRQVCTFLMALNLDHVVQTFRENGVDGEMLSELSEDDLCNELHLTKLQAKKVRMKVPC